MAFRRILAPIDLLHNAEAAMRHSVAIAGAAKAELWALYVAETGRGGRQRPFEWPLESIVPPESGLAIPHRLVLSGTPAQTIADCADEINADLILMPSRGLGAFGQLFRHSTTLDVVRQTGRPIWVVKKDQMRADAAFRCRRVLCGIELGSDGANVLNYASKVARDWSAELSITHVIPDVNEAMLMVYGLDETGEIELAPDAVRRKLVAMAASVDVPYRIDISTGDVATELRNAAKRIQADLIIVGRGRRRNGECGGNIAEIIARSPCPVLTCSGALSGAAAGTHTTVRRALRDSPAFAFRAG
jgi:nucleotide-binding universal stress UspA family protein